METDSMTAEIDETAIQQRLGANVREHREQAGLSQGALAKLAEIDRTFVNQIENGGRNITISVLVRLAAALGTGPADLLHGVA